MNEGREREMKNEGRTGGREKEGKGEGLIVN